MTEGTVGAAAVSPRRLVPLGRGTVIFTGASGSAPARQQRKHPRRRHHSLMLVVQLAWRRHFRFALIPDRLYMQQRDSWIYEFDSMAIALASHIVKPVTCRRARHSA
jgi:hypothetical protein